MKARTVYLNGQEWTVRFKPHPVVAEGVRRAEEESRDADVVLLVLDRSREAAAGEHEGLRHLPPDALVLLNKCDALTDESVPQVIEHRVEQAMRISARTGMGLDRLHDFVLDQMRLTHAHVTIRTHPGNGQVFAFLEKHAHILDRRYRDDVLEIDVRIGGSTLNQLRHRIDDIEVVGT